MTESPTPTHASSTPRANTPATLVLEDGTVFRGRSFGATGEVIAEIIFHTGMTGYQEVLTDPSYRGQMVVMTYPLIGNYGINDLDQESPRPQVSAFIVKELSRTTSNWRSQESVHDYLARYNILGIEGIDTRACVLHLRQQGAMRAVISTERHDPAVLVAACKAAPSMEGQNLVYEVSPTEKSSFTIDPKLEQLNQLLGVAPGVAQVSRPVESKHEASADSSASISNSESVIRNSAERGQRYHVVAYDFGAKRNILNLLAEQNFDVTVVPATTTASDVMAMKPDGVFLSNGPGDPAALPEIVDNVKQLVGQVPMFGICLGHQLLALANGARTYKLKFGHHGANHPVKDLLTQRVEITSQNHGFCVDAATLPKSASITHLNLNDGTVEGFEDEQKKYFAVQYHPEAAPGPHDSSYLFERFREWIERG